MTKERYYEVCEAMGSKPIESEIPVEISDFPYEIQVYIQIFGLLEETWDNFNGKYEGKKLDNLLLYMKMYEVDENELPVVIMYIKTLDNLRKERISNKQKSDKKAA